jgi:hypothetical protein
MPSVPEILLRRTLPEEYVANKRLLDDEEITVMAILDDEGKISTTNQLNDFMLLLTRFERKVSYCCIPTYVHHSNYDFTPLGGSPSTVTGNSHKSSRTRTIEKLCSLWWISFVEAMDERCRRK